MQEPATTAAVLIPGSLWATILTGAVSGAIGAFAADLATDAGRIDRATKDATGWALGFIGKMIVGAVAAIIILTLNPPGESWLALVSTTLAAGVGGDAVVLGFVATGRLDASQRKVDDVTQLATKEIESFRQAIGTNPAGGGMLDAAGTSRLHGQFEAAVVALRTLAESNRR